MTVSSLIAPSPSARSANDESPVRDERTYERFYRAHGDALPGVEGTGLGLNIVRDTVAALGGRAWAEFPEKGSVFAFSLPCRREGDAV